MDEVRAVVLSTQLDAVLVDVSCRSAMLIDQLERDSLENEFNKNFIRNEVARGSKDSRTHPNKQERLHFT